MKKTVKRIVCLALIAALCVSFAGCAKINYVTNGTIQAINEVKSGDWNSTDDADATATEDVDEPVIDELVPDTYGGVEFKDLDDVAAYYKEAYDYTKSLTAQYKDADGNTQTFYKLLGEESLKVGDVYIDGKANSTINSLVPGIVSGMFSANVYGLVPCYNRDPEKDNNLEDDKRNNDHDFRTTDITGDDLLAANVVDNGDGTITLTIQPKEAESSFRGDDSQGRFFEVLGDISGTVADISVVKFAEGDALDNVKVNYKGGTGVIKIDTATKEIVEADYTMLVDVAVNHATVTVIKDKSATLSITYTNHYPASDEYLMKQKSITRL
jgi:hypothetical protein